MGVGYISVQGPRGYPLTVQIVLDCLNRHLATPIPPQVYASLTSHQRAGVESVRIHERGAGAPPILRDFLHASIYFKGLSIERSTIVANFSSQP